MQQRMWLLWLVIGGYLAYLFGSQGRWWAAILCAVVLGYIAARVSPWWGGRSPRFSEVTTGGRHGQGVVVYWRPGCPYCMRLRHRLGPSRAKATWVNIWQDPQAAAFVRSVNGGDEVVPTVVINGKSHTNPDPALVVQALTG